MGYVVFLQKFYYYYLNGYIHDHWQGTIGCNYKTLISMFECKLDSVRRLSNMKLKILNKLKIKNHFFIKDAGWHFSYLGGVEKIIEKMQSTPHTEFSSNIEIDKEKIKSYIHNGNDVFNRKDIKISFIEIDNTFPRIIYDNLDKYDHLIMNLKD
tara:strand:- start:317 stop:778 length:462 start_codon:yes stop_codon:yes gene_type:complete